jgi:hypothetical protein
MMSSLQLGRAVTIMMRTLPILGIRVLVSFISFVIFVVYMLITFGIAALLGNLNQTLGVIVFIIALVAVIPIYNLANRYIFYILKAAHLAIVAELLQNDKLPDGVNQLDWGRQQVQTRFGDVNVMFIVDELVNGVINAFTNTVGWLTAWLPGDTLRTLVGMVKMIIRLSLSYVDEAVLARAFWLRSESVWSTAVDGVVLYAQIWKPILTNAVVLMLLSYIPFVAALIIFAAPVAFILNIFSSDLAAWGIIAALFLAYLIKVSIGDTFAMVAIIATYQKETANLTPNPEMKAKLETLSDKFRELQRHATQELNKLSGSGEKPKTSPSTGV